MDVIKFHTNHFLRRLCAFFHSAFIICVNDVHIHTRKKKKKLKRTERRPKTKFKMRWINIMHHNSMECTSRRMCICNYLIIQRMLFDADKASNIIFIVYICGSEWKINFPYVHNQYIRNYVCDEMRFSCRVKMPFSRHHLEKKKKNHIYE